MHVCITCPYEVAYVVADNDRAVASMARAETLAAIDRASGAVSIDCHTKHSRSTLPVSIGLALLEEVWAQSAGRHPEQRQSMRITAFRTQLVHWLLHTIAKLVQKVSQDHDMGTEPQEENHRWKQSQACWEQPLEGALV